MKRFQFQLEPVLNYKQQSLDSLLIELGTLQAQVRAQEKIREEADVRLSEYEAEYAEKKEEGLTIVEAMECQSCQEVLSRRARQEKEKLLRLQKKAESKRREVVEARKETRSLEKLREVRLSEYDKAAAKAEEKNLDDLTAARRAQAG